MKRFARIPFFWSKAALARRTPRPVGYSVASAAREASWSAERQFRFWQTTFGWLLVLLTCGAGQNKVLTGHVSPLVAHAHRLADLPATQELILSLGLPLQHQDELAVLLTQLYDPRSPQYRHFLDAKEFADRFGPTELDYAAVRKFAEAHGFVVSRTHSNHSLLDVKGTVKNVEEAFHLRMGLYQHPSENRAFYAPDNDPSVDDNIPLLSISGLDNAALPRPASLTERRLSQAIPLSGSGPFGNYWGYDFRQAYVPGVSLTGTGQAVGLFELDGYYSNDIAIYETNTGLPNVPLTNVLLDGFSGEASTNNLEVALDIEMAIAMAPGLSQVLVYEGITPNDILNQMATDNLAKQLSSSWVFSPVNANTEQIYEQFAAQGQSIFQASGDSGAYTSTNPPPAPTDDPWVTSVGGTTLSTGTNAVYASESVWNWNSTGEGNHGGSGGISATWAIPVWQQGLDMSQNQGSTLWRNIPDVAMAADMIWLIASNNNQYSVGGTSAAAPLWAGFMALANQQATGNSLPPVGFANPALYALARGPNYPALFHDITNGNNTNLSISTQFFAESGYDLCTGWGTPNGSNLLNALAQNEIPGATVLNGGFEIGDFTDWAVNAAGTVDVVGTHSVFFSAYVHSGSYGAYLSQPGQLGYLSQSVTTVPARPCLISFWLDNPVGGTPSEFVVWWNGTKLFDQTNLPTFVWTNIQLVANSSSNSGLLEFGFRQDADAFGLDDIGVMPLPALEFQAISAVSNNFYLTWVAWQGLQYQIQYSTNLGNSTWQNLGARFTATNSIMCYSDNLTSDSQRFYRLMLPLNK